MNKLLIILSLALLTECSFTKGISYFDRFDYDCKYSKATDWSYDYQSSTLTILLGKHTYNSVVNTDTLDRIPRNKKLSKDTCKIIKQSLFHNGGK